MGLSWNHHGANKNVDAVLEVPLVWLWMVSAVFVGYLYHLLRATSTVPQDFGEHFKSLYSDISVCIKSNNKVFLISSWRYFLKNGSTKQIERLASQLCYDPEKYLSTSDLFSHSC